MSKFKFNPTVELYPFSEALGKELFAKIANDAKAYIGRLEKNNEGRDIISNLSDVSCNTKLQLVSKEGHKLQMQLNNPMSTFIRCGMELTKIDKANGTRLVQSTEDNTPIGGLQSPVPKFSEYWINQQKLELRNKVTAPAPVTA